MPNIILSDISASINELKKNPMRIVGTGDGFPVAILNWNQPAFYCVPAALYEKMLDALDVKTWSGWLTSVAMRH